MVTSETRLKLFLAEKKMERELNQINKLGKCFTIKPENQSPSNSCASATLSPPNNSRPQSAPRAVSYKPGELSADQLREKQTSAQKTGKPVVSG